MESQLVTEPIPDLLVYSSVKWNLNFLKYHFHHFVFLLKRPNWQGKSSIFKYLKSFFFIIYFSLCGWVLSYKCAACLLLHWEGEFGGGRLDLVLGLQVRHPLGADPINSWDDVTLGQAASRCLAARSYLRKGSAEQVTLEPLIHVPHKTDKRMQLHVVRIDLHVRKLQTQDTIQTVRSSAC